MIHRNAAKTKVVGKAQLRAAAGVKFTRNKNNEQERAMRTATIQTATVQSSSFKSVPMSRNQEMGNSIIHGIGAVLAIPALIILVANAAVRGTIWHVVAYGVFGATMLLLYLASTLFHAASSPRLKRILEAFDHIGVFLLISGSYTAFALTILRSGVGWLVFGIIWGICALGIVMETVFLGRWPFATLAIYLAMGWLIVFVWPQLAEKGSPAMLALLLAGGLSYTAGTVFYALSLRWGWFHLGWHFLVLCGTVCHFFSALAALPPT